MTLRSILIIDDSEFDRYILKRQIKEAGISGHVFEAEDGKSAADFLDDYQRKCEEYPGKLPPCVIFLDINMPRMNGFEFLDYYRDLLARNEALRSTVIMMFSSSEIDEEKRKAFAYDFVKGYITKMPDNGEMLKQQLTPLFPELTDGKG